MLLFLLIAVLSFLVQLFLPWWSMMIVAFALSFLLGKKTAQVFIAAFSACAIVWLLMEIFIHATRGDLMTNRIAELLSLPASVLLYIATFVIAGVVGGVAALAGFFLKEIFNAKRLPQAL